MKIATATLIAAALFLNPAVADEAPAVAAASDGNSEELMVVNGVPVNPELRQKIMESPEQRSVEELIALSRSVIDNQEQDDSAVAAAQQADDAWMNNPFQHLENEMGQIANRIDGSDTGDGTQDKGTEVVSKLDTLIAMMQQAASACQSCSSSGAGSKPGTGPANGGQPAPDSSLAQGPGGSGELRGDGTGNADIESLSDEQRDEILRSGQDGFPEGYEQLLAEYYARLADEAATPPDAEAPGDE